VATYKLIQDIEAEDKLVGPLSFRQFVYALIACFLGYLSFVVIAKHAGFLAIIFIPPALFFGFFAVPFGKDQSTEVWALAKIRFLFKPRRRIWDQSGIKELVTITVPKKVERVFTDGLSQTEVRSRLNALASTIDSRGWAIKNVNVNLYSQPNPLAVADSDRLIDPSSIPQEVPSYDVQASDDIMDASSNPIAQQFDQMIQASSRAHRQQIVNQMQGTAQPAQAPADYWFLNQPAAPANLAPGQATFTNSQVVLPGSTDDTVALAQTETPDEEALAQQLKAQHQQQPASYSHLRTLQPLGSQPTPAATPDPAPPAASPATPDPDILSLAINNDLNVATLARQANKAKQANQPPDDEVVISLH